MQKEWREEDARRTVKREEAAEEYEGEERARWVVMGRCRGFYFKEEEAERGKCCSHWS